MGPNGSGKSALLCALSLGLGGTEKSLPRFSKIKDFIRSVPHERTHATRAFIETTLVTGNPGHTPELTRICRHFDVENKTKYTINGRSVPKVQVKELATRLHIHPDNLCQFLPQEKLHELALSTPKQLLQDTMRTLLAPEVLASYNELVTCQQRVAHARVAITHHTEEVERLRKLNQAIVRIVETFRQREQHERAIAELEMKRPWLLWEEARQQTRAAEQALRESCEEYDRIKADLAPRQRRLVAADKEAKGAQAVALRAHQAVQRRAQGLVCAREAVEDQANELQVALRELAGLQRQKDKRKQEIAALRKRVQQSARQITEYSAQLEAMHPEAIAAEVRERQAEMRAAERDLDDVRMKMDQTSEGIRPLQDQLNQMRNVRARLLATLRPRGQSDVAKVYELIQRNRDQFQQPVLGPLILEIRIPNPAHRPFLEAILGENTLRTFVPQCQQDKNTLWRLLEGKRLKATIVYLDSRDMQPIQHPCPIEQLRAYGATCYLDQAMECSEHVRQVLSNLSSPEKVVIAEDRLLERSEAFFRETPITRVCTPSRIIAHRRSRYDSSASSTSVEYTRAPRFFVDHAENKEQQARLEQQITDRRRIVEEMQGQAREFQQRVNAAQSARDELRGQQQQAIRIRSALTKMRRAHEVNEARLEGMHELDLADSIQKAQEAISTQRARIAQAILSKKDFVVAHTRELFKYERAVVERVAAERTALDLRNSLFEDERRVAELENAKKRLEREVKMHRDEERKLRRVAENAAPSNNEAIKELFKRLPATLAELDERIGEEKRRLDAVIEVVNGPEKLREYEERQDKIQELERGLQEREADQARDLERFEQLKNDWLGHIRGLITKVARAFQSSMRLLGNDGDVQLGVYSDEQERVIEDSPDFEHYGLHILVRFHHSDKLEVLRGRRQSGGEKSVTIMVFLLALQSIGADNSPCPFRIVDEINQGMDPTNERRIFDLISKFCARSNSPQYFVITPKLLHDFNYPEHITILVPFAGPHLFSQLVWRKIQRALESEEEDPPIE